MVVSGVQNFEPLQKTAILEIFLVHKSVIVFLVSRTSRVIETWAPSDYLLEFYGW